MGSRSHISASHTSLVLAGALAHLSRYLEHRCRRSASLAAMLFEQLASDTGTEEHLRTQASQWVELLDDLDARPTPVHAGAVVDWAEKVEASIRRGLK
ncbi:hypothetical protein [uncultured Propionivibrio sp.]|uniref:hypothetical protein n=1 Tax=uncultured Propionivibrio sp. TaxID=426737 RepID=UPI0029C08C1F|nr:hypothetical protein [uncultured Propionivibrio sp.]